MEPGNRFPALQRADLGDGGGDLIVYCWAKWSTYDGTCGERLAEAAEARGILHWCRSQDVDEPAWWEDLRHWGIVNVPAIAFFRNGSRVETVIGLCSVEQLEAALARWTVM